MTVWVDAAACLAAIETAWILERAPGARLAAVVALLAFVAFGASLLLAAPAAVVLGPWVHRSTRRRGVLGALAAFAVAAASVTDATIYVHLYPVLHVALGLVAAAGAVLLRSALPERPLRPRGVVLRLAVASVAFALWRDALAVRHDVREYATTRGVLLADTMYAVLPRARALPDVPLAPRVAPAPAARVASDARRVSAKAPPLVLLVTVDALRFDAVAGAVTGPFAALQAQSASFTMARAAAPWTVPSTYALLTSRAPWHVAWKPGVFLPTGPVPYDRSGGESSRAWPLPMHDTAPTLAGALHDRGYETRVCSVIPFQLPGAGLVRGFDVVDEEVLRAGPAPLTRTTSDALSGCALRMIEEAHGKPLFLWLHYTDTHAPYASHAETPAADGSARAHYDSETRYVERSVGALLDAVDERVGPDAALVVLTADHGEEFGEHGGAYHGATLFDEVLHVPLLIGGAGIAARTLRQNVSLLDVAPTLLDLVGADALPHADGRSLVPLLDGEAMDDAPVIAETVRADHLGRAIVRGRYKLVYGTRAKSYALYDLESDPAEQRVVTDSHPEIVRELAARMGTPAP